MNRLNINSKKGFTIIEVVLVLAIAGLIFLMVFIALPNLQRTRADSQRRQDVSRLSTALVNFISSNSQLPGGTGDNATIYCVTKSLGDNLDCPNGTTPLPAGIGTSTNNNVQTIYGKFLYQYLLASGNDDFDDPNGTHYGVSIVSAGQMNNQSRSKNYLSGSTGYNGIIVVAKGARCGATPDITTFETGAGSRNFAIAIRLEGSGVYCIDN